jgi:nucleoside-diphosphate-sugar epimerase
MVEISNSSPVLVTGATGYVAGRIVERLLLDGKSVHAAVRDPSNSEKLKYLNALAEQTPGTISYFKSDLLDAGSFAEAMEGCELVFHTASPFAILVADPQRDLIDPAQLGTRNVVGQANDTKSVKRIVLTSSCAAIYGDNADLQHSKRDVFTEEDWNTTSSLTHQPYSYSKTLAEREAWNIAKSQDRWDLVTINPSLVIGPGINPHATSESFSLIGNFGNGTLKSGVPNYGMGLVDVRDVAEAHHKAGFTPMASGRHIISAHNSSFPEICRVLHNEFGDAYSFPRRTLPKWFVWLVAPMIDKAMTRKIVTRNVGHPFRADNSKSIRELGMQYRPLQQSLVEFFRQLIDSGSVSSERD